MTIKSWARTNPVLAYPYKLLGDWYWRRKWDALRRERDRFVDQAALHYADVDRTIAFALASTRYVVEGDVAMFGITSALFPSIACKWLKAFGETRNLHVFDSWQGYGPPAPSDLEVPEVKRGGWKSGPLAGQVSPDELRHTIERIGHQGGHAIHVGWFSETLPKLPPGTKFAVTVLDPGLFSANDEVLTYLFGNRADPERRRGHVQHLEREPCVAASLCARGLGEGGEQFSHRIFRRRAVPLERAEVHRAVVWPGRRHVMISRRAIVPYSIAELCDLSPFPLTA